MIGLRADSPEYLLKFLLVLVLFNLTAATVCLFISIACPQMGIANLVATLVMLFEMLFGGLLLNKNSVPSYLSWVNHLSFFNCAMEAMAVNEVNGLTLYQNRPELGLSINVSVCESLCVCRGRSSHLIFFRFLDLSSFSSLDMTFWRFGPMSLGLQSCLYRFLSWPFSGCNFLSRNESNWTLRK